MHEQLPNNVIRFEEGLHHESCAYATRNDRELAGRAEIKLLGALVISLPYAGGLRDLASSAMAVSRGCTQAVQAGVREGGKQHGGDFSCFWCIQRVRFTLCFMLGVVCFLARSGVGVG